MWEPGVPSTDLREIYGSWLSGIWGVNAINDRGQMLGVVETKAIREPVLLQSRIAIPLSRLVAGGGVQVQTALTINDAGQILAYATIGSRTNVPVLLTPPGGSVP